MEFHSNPFENLQVIQTICESFRYDDKMFLHFYFEEDSKSLATEFVVNKTDVNKQFFKLTFSKDMEFLDVSENFMIFRE